MTTTTPKFETTRRHTAIGFTVIAALFLSLVAGFVVTTSQKSSPNSDLRAAAPVVSVQHAS